MGESSERILCKLSKSEILVLYSIAHVAMETAKTPNFTNQICHQYIFHLPNFSL